MQYSEIDLGMKLKVVGPTLPELNPRWAKAIARTVGSIITVDRMQSLYRSDTGWKILHYEIYVKESHFIYEPQWLQPLSADEVQTNQNAQPPQSVEHGKSATEIDMLPARTSVCEVVSPKKVGFRLVKEPSYSRGPQIRYSRRPVIVPDFIKRYGGDVSESPRNGEEEHRRPPIPCHYEQQYDYLREAFD